MEKVQNPSNSVNQLIFVPGFNKESSMMMYGGMEL
jgi:hypothetical protein